MVEQYGRRAVVNVDGKQIVSRTFADGSSLGASLGLRLAFKIEKTLKPAPNQAELRIWNLNEDSRKQLVKDAKVSIEAGYGDDTSLIFIGTMKRIDHTRVGPDWITRLRIGDGEKEIKAAHVSTSIKGAVKPAQVVQKLTDALGLPAKSALDKAKKGDIQGALQEMANGYVGAGRAWDELVKTGGMLGYDVSVQDGEVLFLGPEETSGANAILLSQSTGLVGSPEQAESTGDKNKHPIVKAKALLNGALAPGRAVDLQSASFKGFYRVEKVTIDADTHTNDWFCDLELKGIQ